MNSLPAGAARETLEEALATVELGHLFASVDVVDAGQVHFFFTGKLVGDYGAGDESLEAALFCEDEIPWDEIAFHSGTFALKKYFEDRGENNGVHIHELQTLAFLIRLLSLEPSLVQGERQLSAPASCSPDQLAILEDDRRRAAEADVSAQRVMLASASTHRILTSRTRDQAWPQSAPLRSLAHQIVLRRAPRARGRPVPRV